MNSNDRLDMAAQIRKNAEQVVRRNPVATAQHIESMSADEVSKLMHELQVHQIELEMQNHELVSAQLELSTSRARYFELYDMAPVGYLTMSEEGMITEANITACSMLNTPRKALKGKMVTSMICNGHQDDFYLALKRLLKVGDPQTGELLLKKSTGDMIWTRVDISLTNTVDQGKIINLTLCDISSEKKAEEELYMANRSLAAMSACNRVIAHAETEDELLNEICQVVTEKGGYRGAWIGLKSDDGEEISPAAQYLFPNELSESNEPGRDITAQGRIQAQRAISQADSVVSNNIMSNPNYEPWRHDAQLHRYESSASIPFTFDSSGVGVLTIYSEECDSFTSSEVALLVELANDIAYGISALRTAVAHKEAEAAKEAAERTNKLKDQFLANISHELRTPLNSILGYAQLMERQELNKKQISSVGSIKKSGLHLLGIINDILDLSKIIAGEMDYQKSTFKLESLVSDCCQLVQPKFDKKKILLNLECDLPGDYAVESDEIRLRQVLINLLINAVKFTDSGSVTFRICAPSANRVEFSVIDTGCGISQSALADIFKPFFQVDSYMNSPEGTGLGLAISGNIVANLGGELCVNSKKGEGSVFSFELELPKVTTSVEVADVSHRNVTFAGATKTVLVVDDHEMNRLLLSTLMSDVGLKTLAADSGVTAVEVVKKSRPDLILMDIMMPLMDGIEAILRIRQWEKENSEKNGDKKHMAIVALSASVMPEAVQEALDAGCDAFLPKPYDQNDLIETIEGLLGIEPVYDPSMDIQDTCVPVIAENIELPDQLLEELTVAARLGRMKVIEELIDKMRLDDSPEVQQLCSVLQGYATAFELQQIQELLSQIRH